MSPIRGDVTRPLFATTEIPDWQKIGEPQVRIVSPDFT